MIVKFKIEVIGLTETNKDDSCLLKLRLEGKIVRFLKLEIRIMNWLQQGYKH